MSLAFEEMKNEETLICRDLLDVTGSPGPMLTVRIFPLELRISLSP